jgi:hypothetical protein
MPVTYVTGIAGGDAGDMCAVRLGVVGRANNVERVRRPQCLIDLRLGVFDADRRELGWSGFLKRIAGASRADRQRLIPDVQDARRSARETKGLMAIIEATVDDADDDLASGEKERRVVNDVGVDLGDADVELRTHRRSHLDFHDVRDVGQRFDAIERDGAGGDREWRALVTDDGVDLEAGAAEILRVTCKLHEHGDDVWRDRDFVRRG